MKILYRISSFFLCFSGFASIAAAQDMPGFAFPVACTLGESCTITNYMDVDPSENATDFTCRGQSYNGNNGTDITLYNRGTMKNGVNVLAAADGRISRIRDGESDSIKTKEQFDEVKEAGKECGNGIVITHAPGLSTYYCHLRVGSVKIKNGDEVKKGDVIAQIGQSGIAEYPHLHFSVIWESGYVDPFSNKTINSGCGGKPQPIWDNKVEYQHFAIIQGGFSNGVPNFKDILEFEKPKTLPQFPKALVFWTGYHHAKTGDQVTIKITGPRGETIREKTITISEDRTKPNYFYTGREIGSGGVLPGEYKATATFVRQGIQPVTITDSIQVTP